MAVNIEREDTDSRGIAFEPSKAKESFGFIEKRKQDLKLTFRRLPNGGYSIVKRQIENDHFHHQYPAQQLPNVAFYTSDKESERFEPVKVIEEKMHMNIPVKTSSYVSPHSESIYQTSSINPSDITNITKDVAMSIRCQQSSVECVEIKPIYSVVEECHPLRFATIEDICNYFEKNIEKLGQPLTKSYKDYAFENDLFDQKSKCFQTTQYEHYQQKSKRSPNFGSLFLPKTSKNGREKYYITSRKYGQPTMKAKPAFHKKKYNKKYQRKLKITKPLKEDLIKLGRPKFPGDKEKKKSKKMISRLLIKNRHHEIALLVGEKHQRINNCLDIAKRSSNGHQLKVGSQGNTSLKKLSGDGITNQLNGYLQTAEHTTSGPQQFVGHKRLSHADAFMDSNKGMMNCDDLNGLDPFVTMEVNNSTKQSMKIPSCKDNTKIKIATEPVKNTLQPYKEESRKRKDSDKIRSNELVFGEPKTKKARNFF